MKKFYIGQRLQSRFIGDADSILIGEVVKRTAKTVTVKIDMWGTKTRRIGQDHDGHEMIFPLGQYSMAPVFRASRETESC